MKGDKTQKFDFVTDTTSQKKKVKETHRAIEKCPSLATNSCFKKEKKKVWIVRKTVKRNRHVCTCSFWARRFGWGPPSFHSILINSYKYMPPLFTFPFGGIWACKNHQIAERHPLFRHIRKRERNRFLAAGVCKSGIFFHNSAKPEEEKSCQKREKLSSLFFPVLVYHWHDFSSCGRHFEAFFVWNTRGGGRDRIYFFSPNKKS